MATPANTFTSVDAKGVREDLSNIIYNISPTETPFTSNIGKGKAAQSYHEWQLEDLAAASDENKHVEGDDATTDAATATERVGNRTQISDKVARVSGSLEAYDKAGRESEFKHQKLLKGQELKRDIEKQMLSLKPSVAGTSATPGQSAGFGAWLTSNVSRGVGGANGGFNTTTKIVDAPTAGTARDFTEAMLGDVMQSAFTNGGKPSMLFLPPGQKRKFSAFAGISDIRNEAPKKGQATIIGGADVYVGDFGELTTVPSIFMPTTVAYGVDPKKAKKAIARPMKDWPLAKTGDSERAQILEEYTLEVCNEAAHFGIFDLT